MRIRVKSKKYNLDIDLQHKISVVRGNSATGKTTLIKVLDEFRTMIKPELDDGFRLAVVTPGGVHTFTEKKMVYVVDENVEIDSEIAERIKTSTDSYFLIFRRSDLSMLNFSIYALYNFVMEANVHRLQPIVHKGTGKTRYDIRPDTVLVEDSGKGFTWFKRLFERTDIKIDTTYGKDKVISRVEKEIKDSKKTVIVMFDEISFGNHIIKLIKLCERYDGEICYYGPYKSFEYLVLQSNMFKSMYRPYSIAVPDFEEGYYEDGLAIVSHSKYGTLSHNGKSELPKCYYEPCCAYTGNKDRDCTFGIQGDDKFIAMLKGTELSCLLRVAGRI